MKKITMHENQIRQELITIYENVKDIVWKVDHHSRAGLMLGLQEIGASLDGFIGAYYPITSNIIIMNKTPLRRIIETNQKIMQPYVFHILLHEYIHALGFYDETITRQKTYDISRQQFGEKNLITQMSTNMKKFFPNLVYPIQGWTPSQELPPIELVTGFDASNINSYIT
jgi:hypothetical protein